MRLPSPIVDAAWLADHLHEVVVADVRWYLDGRSGRAAYERGHLPGAIFVDIDTDLSGTPGGTRGGHPLPGPEQFAVAMSTLGISNTTPVVAYDDTGGMTAGRLVWMLRVIGSSAALLDGGLNAWDGPLDSGHVACKATTFTQRPWPLDATVDADEVGRHVKRSDGVVLDARSLARYRGDDATVDQRAGHIPGSLSAHWAANLDAAGRFLSRDELRARYTALGIGPHTAVVASCGSGVSACADLLALERAGLGGPFGGRLFVASWSGWSADASRPVATGSVPRP